MSSKGQFDNELKTTCLDPKFDPQSIASVKSMCFRVIKMRKVKWNTLYKKLNIIVAILNLQFRILSNSESATPNPPKHLVSKILEEFEYYSYHIGSSILSL